MKLRGSLTVEASLLMPLVLFMLAFSLKMTGYLTDTVRAEAVIEEGSLRDEEDAGEWMKETGGFITLTSVAFEAGSTGSQVRTSARSEKESLWPGQKRDVACDCRHKVRNPAAWVQKIRGLSARGDE